MWFLKSEKYGSIVHTIKQTLKKTPPNNSSSWASIIEDVTDVDNVTEL